MFFGKLKALKNRLKMLETSFKALFERVGRGESRIKHLEKNLGRAEKQIREAQTARNKLATRIMKLEANK